MFETHKEFPDQITQFQVLGERSSGTNVLSAFINRNTRLAPSTHLGWKHGFPQAQFYPRNLLTVVSFRHPLDWVRSMHRKPWHAAPRLQGLSFSDFIRAEWESVIDNALLTDDPMNLFRLERLPRALRSVVWNHYSPRIGWKLRRQIARSDPTSQTQAIAAGVPLQYDRHPITGEQFENIFKLRTAKAQGYLGLRHRACNYLFVSHELYRSDPDKIAQALSDVFGIAVSGDLQGIDRKVGQMNRAGSENTENKVGPPADVADDDLDFMVSQLCRETESQMGYDISLLGKTTELV
ncbi:hypothetical protein [Pseudaestuariivita rosea]|uniref:hypothetical protein n=1 Tax=Pseudaestuariivita rosea TaxID=2763263 RepID=UPI001ABAE8B0|nr:hypothetical protein [Pseudaestuariivita rosea]